MPFVTDNGRAGRAEAHLSRRAVVAVAACLGLLVLAGVAAIYLAHRASVAERWVAHTLQVRDETLDLMTTVLATQGGIYEYLATGNRDFLEPYDAAVGTLAGAVDHLLDLAADNPGQQAAIATARSSLDALADHYRRALAVAERDGREAAVPLLRAGGGNDLIGTATAAIDAVADEELRLLGERQAAAERLRSWALLLVLGALLAATILAAWLCRWMLHYVNQLVVRTAELERETALRLSSEASLAQAQKMEAVGQLAGGIAHDFNNMLTIVLGNVSTVLRRLRQQGEPPPTLVQPLEAAIQGAEGAAKLTHRLLAFSRRQPLAPSQVDLNRVVSGVIDLVRRSIGESVELESVLAAGLWPTFADSHQLENVLVNLVVNARDAMPDGGRVTIETSNAFLDEGYAGGFDDVVPGQYVVLGVTDTGQGIAPDLLEHVFEPFFTTKPEGEGSGLGLAMTHGFVKQSGGHIRIYSEVGQGTTVKIYLPRLVGAERVPAVPAAVPDRVAEGDARGSETILVVEDNDGVRAHARSALEESGYVVVEAVDAAGALGRIDDGVAVDLVFTDVVLGRGPSGRELADAIAGRGLALPVLFTTGYSRNAIMLNGRVDPGVGLLEKPYTQQDLVRRVRSILDRRGRTAEGAGRRE